MEGKEVAISIVEILQSIQTLQRQSYARGVRDTNEHLIREGEYTEQDGKKGWLIFIEEKEGQDGRENPS